MKRRILLFGLSAATTVAVVAGVYTDDWVLLLLGIVAYGLLGLTGLTPSAEGLGGCWRTKLNVWPLRQPAAKASMASRTHAVGPPE